MINCEKISIIRDGAAPPAHSFHSTRTRNIKNNKNLVTCWIGPANNNTNIASAANLNSPPVSVHSRDKSRQMLVKIALDNN